MHALKRQVEASGARLFNGREVMRLALRGDYPDTELVVAFTDQNGDPGTEAFDLWHEDPPGNVNEPKEAELTADIIFINVAGM